MKYSAEKSGLILRYSDIVFCIYFGNRTMILAGKNVSTFADLILYQKEGGRSLLIQKPGFWVQPLSATKISRSHG